MNIQLLTCMVLVTSYVKVGGSLSDLRSQQVCLKRWDSEVKENQKEMYPKLFWEVEYLWGGCWSDFILPRFGGAWP